VFRSEAGSIYYRSYQTSHCVSIPMIFVSAIFARVTLTAKMALTAKMRELHLLPKWRPTRVHKKSRTQFWLSDSSGIIYHLCRKWADGRHVEWPHLRSAELPSLTVYPWVSRFSRWPPGLTVGLENLTDSHKNKISENIVCSFERKSVRVCKVGNKKAKKSAVCCSNKGSRAIFA
jgi:hypothetical protein